MKNNLQKIQLIFVLLSVLMAIIFIFGSLIPYIQMNKYRSTIISENGFYDVLEKDSIFYPQTTVTGIVCVEMISRVSSPLTKTVAEISPEAKLLVPVFENILIRCGDFLEKSTDPVDRFFISTIYGYLGHITGEKKYFDKSDELIDGMFKLSPKRQPFVEFMGVNSFLKRDFVKSKYYFIEALKTNPDSRQARYYLNVINSFGIK